MALTTNTRTQSTGVANFAYGKAVTDANATALTITVGFVPRKFVWTNATTTAAFKSDEVREGMAALTSIRTAAVATSPAANQVTVATDGPTINSDGTVTIPVALAPASSTFYWEAIG